jgi:hypothetical protein
VTETPTPGGTAAPARRPVTMVALTTTTPSLLTADDAVTYAAVTLAALGVWRHRYNVTPRSTGGGHALSRPGRACRAEDHPRRRAGEGQQPNFG